MAQLVVRNLDNGVKEKLRRRAARRRHSLEAEVRDILSDAVALWKRNSTRCCETTSAAASPPSTPWRRKKLRDWPRGGNAGAGLSIFATLRSPVSRSHDERPWRLATYGTSTG